MTAMAAESVAVTNDAGALRRRGSALRNVELRLLLFAVMVTTGYAVAVDVGAAHTVTRRFWVLPVALSLVWLAAHVALRWWAPYADPVMVPCMVLINGLGVVFLHR